MDNVVLVADPDPERCADLIDALDRAGFSCLAARTGSEALATVARYAPQLILLRTDLPEVQGTDVCLRIKQEDETGSRAVILITADESKEERFIAEEVGADVYLTDDTDLDELINYVRELYYRDGLNAAARGLRPAED